MLNRKSLILILLILSNISLFASDGFIMGAMRDEIKRTLKDLKLENLQKAYYVEYKITLRQKKGVKSSLGSVLETSDLKNASLSVGLRVGSYKFDNTNFFDFGFSFFGSGDDEESYKNRTIPIELDYETLRRELWLATDAAYKQVSEIYSKKETVVKNRIIKDTTYDFLKMGPETLIDTNKLPDYDKNKFEDLSKSCSAVFLKFPDINVSSVGIEYLPETIYYVNSEGREYIKNDYYFGLEAVAVTQSNDGMPSSNYYTVFAKKPDDFPSKDSLLKAMNLMASRLIDLKNAETLDEPYSGPVLFEQEAAAELFAQVFAPNLATQRDQMTEQGFQDNDRNTAFQNKIGGRVLPEFLSLSDIPSKKDYNGTVLMGHNIFDDEGVKTEDVELVKDGYLKNLLSCRVPTKRVRKSNGHQFGGSAMFSTILLSSTENKIQSNENLKKNMLKLCKDRELPFGILVRKAQNQNILFTTMFRMTSGEFSMGQLQQKVPLVEAYKVYPDGREVLLRGVDAKGFTPQSFKDILNVGNKNYVLNFLAPSITNSFMSGGRQYITASVIVPDLLFEDGEIRSVESDFPKPPILKNPIAG